MKTVIINCQYCEKEFTAKRADAKFCNNACRQQAYLERGKSYFENEKQVSQQSIHENKKAVLALRNEIKEIQETLLSETQRIQEPRILEEIGELQKRVEENIKKQRMSSINEAIDKTNGLLKKWISQLLEFDRQEEISLDKVKRICDEITLFNEFDKCNLPDDYQHLGFIENILVPKAKSWSDEIKYMRDRYINLHLSEELKNKLVDLLDKI